MSSQYFIEYKWWFDLVATDNHSQDFTKNKHCVNHDHKCEVMTAVYQSVNKSNGEDGFMDGSMFYHTIQQYNISIDCDMM